MLDNKPYKSYPLDILDKKPYKSPPLDMIKMVTNAETTIISAFR